jgi:hypothetical protein
MVSIKHLVSCSDVVVLAPEGSTNATKKFEVYGRYGSVCFDIISDEKRHEFLLSQLHKHLNIDYETTIDMSQWFIAPHKDFNYELSELQEQRDNDIEVELCETYLENPDDEEQQKLFCKALAQYVENDCSCFDDAGLELKTPINEEHLKNQCSSSADVDLFEEASERTAIDWDVVNV